MASSSHSAVAPRQKAAELVSPKGICVVAHFVQCFSILPNRFLLKGYRCCYRQAMALGPFRSGGGGQTLSHPTQYFSLTLNHLHRLLGGGAGEESGRWKSYRWQLRHADRLESDASLRDPDTT